MRRLIFFIVASLIIITSACAQNEDKSKEDSPINWLTNLEEAQEISKNEDKPIFVHFTGSDWCGWCFKLHDEVYSKQAFIDYADSDLVMVVLDFPKKIKQPANVKKYNRAIADKYQITGFPTVLLLNSEGEVIAKTGFKYGGAEKYVVHLKELLSK